MTKAQQIKLINEAFDAIPELEDGRHFIGEHLFELNKQSERRHRKGAIGRGNGITVQAAAKLFTVRHLLEGYAAPDYTLADILWVRHEVLYAQVYAQRHLKELKAWFEKYAEPFKAVDYAELNRA